MHGFICNRKLNLIEVSLGAITKYTADVKYFFCFVSTGHKDSVTCAVFSHDSSLVASGDMSGMIKVWKVETKEEIWSFEVGDLEVRTPLQRVCVCLKYCISPSLCICVSV